MTFHALVRLLRIPVFCQSMGQSRPGYERAVRAAVPLMANPEAGKVIPGSGGYRKLRLALPGRGRRSGARVIYRYDRTSGEIFLANVYAKNE